jgi:hypothetical protein
MCARFPKARVTGLDITDWNIDNSYVSESLDHRRVCAHLFALLGLCQAIIRVYLLSLGLAQHVEVHASSSDSHNVTSLEAYLPRSPVGLTSFNVGPCSSM